MIGRIFQGEYGEPPEGVDVLPWFSCILLKAILEEKDYSVSREEFTGMAAVIMGFISDGARLNEAESPEGDGPVISQRQSSRTRK